MAGRLGDVVADMERRRHTYRRAAEDLRRVALCATLTDDDPRWRFSAVRRDRSDAPRLPGDTMAATASRSPAEPARRRFERQPGYRIESSLDAAGLPPTKASLIDISRGGAAFACQWAAQPGLHVIISFAGKRRRLRARVVRNNNDALAVSFLQDADPAMDAAPYGPRIEAPRSGPDPQASGKPPTSSQRRPTYRLRSEGTSDFDPLSGLTTARPQSPGSAKETNQRVNAGSMPNHPLLRRLPHPRVRALATEQARGQVRTQRVQHFRVAAAGGGGLLTGVLLGEMMGGGRERVIERDVIVDDERQRGAPDPGPGPGIDYGQGNNDWSDGGGGIDMGGGGSDWSDNKKNGALRSRFCMLPWHALPAAENRLDER